MSAIKHDNETGTVTPWRHRDTTMHFAPDTQFRVTVLTILCFLRTEEGQRRAVNF